MAKVKKEDRDKAREEEFNGTANIGDIVLYSPPLQLEESFVAIITEAFPGGIVSLYVYPTPTRRDQSIPSIPHISDKRLFEENGFPSEACRKNGYWMHRPKQVSNKGKQ